MFPLASLPCLLDLPSPFFPLTFPCFPPSFLVFHLLRLPLFLLTLSFLLSPFLPLLLFLSSCLLLLLLPLFLFLPSLLSLQLLLFRLRLLLFLLASRLFLVLIHRTPLCSLPPSISPFRRFSSSLFLSSFLLFSKLHPQHYPFILIQSFQICSVKVCVFHHLWAIRTPR